MRNLSSLLRRQLEARVLDARRAAETACRAALDGLGVFSDRRPEHLDSDQVALRNGLRAKQRQLGGDADLLVLECAYEQWHRLLFARFLAENSLLLHPQYKAPLTLAECEELADDLGEPDGWSVAARFAAEILPGIFRLDDPCVRLRLAPEGRDALEKIIAALPPEVFSADDALGWVYQFWQRDKKDEVNASERKIAGSDLGPVTQLFTENYMVRFLLENSLGAWWATLHPGSPLLSGFEYLRFDREGRPAAGGFTTWPTRVRDITVMDPCCGSGHFLVEAFSMLWQMRSEEEGLEPLAAQDAVLQDNLFGLELDPRCVQIAMFAIALQTWKLGGGWRQLPMPNIACSGIPVKAELEEWNELAAGDQRLQKALGRLHFLFRNADTLGSLIDPRGTTEHTGGTRPQRSIDDVDWTEVAPVLSRATSQETADPAMAALGMDAAAIARAADFLSRQYTLVATNVPYLTTENQATLLKDYSRLRFPLGKADLATTFLVRALEFVAGHGAVALVTPQAWLTLGGYRHLREWSLRQHSWAMLARLGPRAFEGISGEVVNVGLFVLSATRSDAHLGWGMDLISEPSAAAKDRALRTTELVPVEQHHQLENPDARVILGHRIQGPLLNQYASSLWGLHTADNPRFRRFFWELPRPSPDWAKIQTSVPDAVPYGGRQELVLWEEDRGTLRKSHEAGSASIQGMDAWGREGVAVTLSGKLPVTRYTGEIFANSTSAVWPHDPEDLPALWAFLNSPEFNTAVRMIDQKVIVMNQTLLKVAFDRERWRRIASEAGELPEPHSDDPTQWLFDGHPRGSAAPLQVAVARLVGYRWPEAPEVDDLDGQADSDGIVCLPSVAGEAPAADRLQRVLAEALEGAWPPGNTKALLEAAGSPKKDLAEWLRDDFFKQHCAMFGNRPFVWHIWDGQRDGFAALVNYHRLDRRTLERLTYTYLGQDWVERQRAAVRDEVAGAETRLTAALELQVKLEAILTGEKPFDIYVRWKAAGSQPIGWEPDLNDGVRLNIRPFVNAAVLRSPFNIHWRKDRGKDTDGSERHNDLHLSLAEKLESRKSAGRP